MAKPVCIDLYCGLGGWAEGFLAEGYDVIGFDIERHDYGKGTYPGQLVLQDAVTLHGSQFAGAACIVASPPCQKYSYMFQPWRRAKVEAAWQRWFRDSGSPFADAFTLNDLFNACFRIRDEASRVAGRQIPLIVENVVGAQAWVGRAAWHYGPYYLWGDVPALMPSAKELKGFGGTWFGIQSNGRKYDQREVNPVSGSRKQRVWLNDDLKRDGVKCGGDWLGSGKDRSLMRSMWSTSPGRKAASAEVAKIPLALSEWIAQCFKPVAAERVA